MTQRIPCNPSPSATCDICGEKPLLRFDSYGRRFHFCGQCANEMKPYAWGTEEWSDFINWFDTPGPMFGTDDNVAI